MDPTPATNIWLANLIETQAETLTDTLTTMLRQNIPAYQQMPEAEIRPRFLAMYQGTAAALRRGDFAPHDPGMEQGVANRMRAGLSPEEYLRMAEWSYRIIRTSIETAIATPDQRTEALHLIDTLERNMRLFFSRINLRRLTGDL